MLREKRHRKKDREYQRLKREIGLVDKTQEYREWRKNHPEAYKAHMIFNNNKKNKKIKIGECELKDETCSKTIQAHHPNYNEPYNVIWLCASHHKRVDMGIIKLTN